MTPPKTRRLSIAIVDDDRSVRVSLVRLCGVFDLDATAYASGLEFLASLDNGAPHPDCLLLDAQMPGMSGLELQRHLVAGGIRIPTVAFTADDTPRALADYAAVGIKECLRKPASGDDLLAAIARAVNTPGPPSSIGTSR